MNEKELLTKKMILVGMNDAKISTEDKPIIGTEALATCLGVLLYSEEKKVAIVAHVSSEPIIALDKLFNLIIDNKLLRIPFKYKIFLGYDIKPAEYYQVVEVLEKHFKDFIQFDDNEIPDYAVNIDEKTQSKEFAFDASVGKFVTDKVLFGIDYLMINNEEYRDDTNGVRCR